MIDLFVNPIDDVKVPQFSENARALAAKNRNTENPNLTTNPDLTKTATVVDAIEDVRTPKFTETSGALTAGGQNHSQFSQQISRQSSIMETRRKPTAAVRSLSKIVDPPPLLRLMSGWLMLATCIVACRHDTAAIGSRLGRSIITVPSFCHGFSTFAEDGSDSTYCYYTPPPSSPRHNSIDDVLLAVIKQFDRNNEAFRRKMEQANEESWRKFQCGFIGQPIN
ncbi:Hypothetical protein CINCED_3A009869 [Cinara cedri]|uniref:Uncharacterized protein n=1 Tax=Cinara cedri TaxID=506608 RepID=A0A5E4M3V0_9HEMI|nr:Hypothetical protein CINCED_3A009869 [Cinara cedri]